MFSDKIRRFLHSLIKCVNFLASLLVKPLIASKLITAYHPVPSLGISISKHREDAVYNRWKAIERCIPGEMSSVLDVGCNLGYYSIECAKKGHFTVGVDIQEYAILLNIIKNRLGLNNLVPVSLKISPENAASFPSFDVVVLLQVFHHFCFVYGADAATKILRELWGKCNKRMVFEVEPPSERRKDYATRMPVDMLEEGTENWLRKVLSNGQSEEFIIQVIYEDVSRSRAVYCIERC